jgi:hypothetical protein
MVSASLFPLTTLLSSHTRPTWWSCEACSSGNLINLHLVACLHFLIELSNHLVLVLLVWFLCLCWWWWILPYCSTHEQGGLCGGVVSVMVVLLVWWWCCWSAGVSWPTKSTYSDLFILALVPWWLDTSIHAYGEWYTCCQAHIHGHYLGFKYKKIFSSG